MDWAHVRDGRDLFGVGLDPSLRHDKPKEHASGDPKNTFFGVQSDPLSLEASERFVHVGVDGP